MAANLAEDVTALLAGAQDGDLDAQERALRILYPELRRIAGSVMRGERDDHTLRPTALVGEAFIALFGNKKVQFNDRAHFFRTAARQMRWILVNHARKRLALKCGGRIQRVPLEWEQIATSENQDTFRVALVGELLTWLETIEPHLATVVDLRFFMGLTHREISAIFDISVQTVDTQWNSARALLKGKLG